MKPDISSSEYVIASSRNWRLDLAENVSRRIGRKVAFIGDKHRLTRECLDTIGAKRIFFPHWSHIIPREIYEAYECIIFHMTDVPFGRGGSPLQNLIARGIYETRISALRCSEELDAGPVYMKRPLSLYGSAEEIYIRATGIIEEMIVSIIQERPEPQPQSGEVVTFRRRDEADGDISRLLTLEQVYDYIRMLDAEGYPKAFLETDQFRLEFSRASLKAGGVVADVVIRMKSNEE